MCPKRTSLQPKAPAIPLRRRRRRGRLPRGGRHTAGPGHPLALERLEVFMAREQLEEPLPMVTRYRHAFTDAALPRPRSGQPPIDHPESRDNVVAAWYADRAVPFPTLLGEPSATPG
jgi:hypothetical protein